MKRPYRFASRVLFAAAVAVSWLGVVGAPPDLPPGVMLEKAALVGVSVFAFVMSMKPEGHP